MTERTIFSSRRQGRRYTCDARLWETELGAKEFEVAVSIDSSDKHLLVSDARFRVEDMLPLAEMIILANLYRKNGKYAKRLLPLADSIAKKNGQVVTKSTH